LSIKAQTSIRGATTSISEAEMLFISTDNIQVNSNKWIVTCLNPAARMHFMLHKNMKWYYERTATSCAKSQFDANAVHSFTI